jgi:hypothetical protein
MLVALESKATGLGERLSLMAEVVGGAAVDDVDGGGDDGPF